MKMYQVDAFTTELFKGNPAAVIVLEDWLEDELMQNIALENNLSETAFVKVMDNENYAIRWFAPTREVDFVVMRHWPAVLYYSISLVQGKRFIFM